MKVLKLVDQDKNTKLSIIYEAMDRAKLAIKASVKNREKYWEVMDKRWSNQLHRHLHVAGNKKIPYIVFIIYSNAKYYILIIFLLMTTYFLNPMFHYSKQFSHHPKIKIRLKEVIK